jgi:hypothetical protein
LRCADFVADGRRIVLYRGVLERTPFLYQRQATFRRRRRRTRGTLAIA